jgi:type IV pilus assembly protein PilE
VEAIVKSNKESGFTLVELVVAMAIIGILLAIAIPSYQSHMRKSHRAEVQAYLMDLAQREQQYFTDNRAYAIGADATTALNDTMPSSLTSYYRISGVSAGTIANSGQVNPPAFTITAYAINNQASDGDLKIDSTGAKSPSDKW